MIVADFPFFPIKLHPEMGRKPLYMCAPFPSPDGVGLLIECDKPLTVDGVMTSLYDREVLPIIGDRRLALRVKAQGPCRISLIHRKSNGEEAEYGSAISAKAIRDEQGAYGEGEIQVFDLDFQLMNSEQSFGRWFFRIQPLRSDVKLLSAEWLVREAELVEIVPAFVVCTFKRERQVTANVNMLTKVLGRTPAMLQTKVPSSIRQIGLVHDASSEGDTDNSRHIETVVRKLGRVEEPVYESVAKNPGYANLDDFGILIVDNAGTLSEAEFSSPHVRLISQRNVGGAGGFGRGIYEAIGDRRYSHIILLDDDADIDDVSIVRMMNLLRLNKDDDLFIGGLQFDTYTPCQLADAGTYWTPERFERPIGRLEPSDMGAVEGRDGLARSYNCNFNGWWLFGGSVEGFKTFGMPLPCFVHLDDVEFGVRVQLNGGRTLTVPGIAVWHEPYYAKVEGWFAYYNIRNELIRLSVQAPKVLSELTDLSASQIEKRSSKLVASASRQLRRRFRDFVNAYQYGSAVLLAKAIEDFIAGPDVLMAGDAEALHLDVMADFKKTTRNYCTSKTLPAGFIPEAPSRGHKLYRLAQIYLRNGHRAPIPLRRARSNRVTMFQNRRDINWKFTRARQAWGYPDPGSSIYHIYKFDRESYAAVSKRFKQAIRRFDDRARETQAKWFEVYPEMISHEFWRKLIKTF